jgi:hypothetical protein
MDIEIGLGGDLYLPNKNESFRKIVTRSARDLHQLDSNLSFDYVEGIPESADDGKWAEDQGFPFRVFTALYVIDQTPDYPQALDELKKNLELCAQVPTIKNLNMQVMGDSSVPNLDQLTSFYQEATRLASAQGVTLSTETHIDRFTHDPSRMMEVHDHLMTNSHGELGLNIWADFSHYVHQFGHPEFLNSHPARDARYPVGRDGFDALLHDIMNSGLIVGGHMRCATPNALNRVQGSIQYPISAPSGDPYADASDDLQSYGIWQEEKTRVWKDLYRKLFKTLKEKKESGTAMFASEFIVHERDYKIDDYSNYWQNLQVIAWAKETIDSLP